jgi:hypothetical protein
MGKPKLHTDLESNPLSAMIAFHPLPSDTLLMDAPAGDFGIESAATAAAPRPAAWRRLLRNWSVRIGGAVLALLALVSLLAPWLGTIDPTLLDPVNRDLLPGSPAEVVLLTGESFRHTFWMGTDSYGRDIYSRVLYGGRVSLVVGVAVAALSLLFGTVIGLAAVIYAGSTRWRCASWTGSWPFRAFCSPSPCLHCGAPRCGQ